MITARQYALANGIPERTVRQWVGDLTDEERAAQGIQQVGRAWVASEKTWGALASVERVRGPKTKPQEP